MQAKNFSKMVLLDKNTLKPNSIALHLMRMVFAILEEPMVASMFGIKSKISDLF